MSQLAAGRPMQPIDMAKSMGQTAMICSKSQAWLPSLRQIGKKAILNSDINQSAGGNVNFPEEAIEYIRHREDVVKVLVYTKDGDAIIGFMEL